MVITPQMKAWKGFVGESYTHRCFRTAEDDNLLGLKHWGKTRIDMFNEFISRVDRNSRVLEVGCNVGNKLAILKKMGFKHLYGIELQECALKIARKTQSGITFVRASAFDIPFPDRSFDLVYTSGVLIHISPENLAQAMTAIYNCSARFIWGFEYYDHRFKEIKYHGKEEMLWKGNYVGEYQKICPDLKLLKEKKFPYLYNDDQDVMFLLKKTVE